MMLVDQLVAPNDLILHLCPEVGFEGVRHYTEQQLAARETTQL